MVKGYKEVNSVYLLRVFNHLFIDYYAIATVVDEIPEYDCP